MPLGVDRLDAPTNPCDTLSPVTDKVRGRVPPSRASDLRPVFESLYEALYADLLRFVQRRVRHDQAEDVVSDASWWSGADLRNCQVGSEDARAWIFGIARNLLLNDRRGGERRQALGVHLAAVAAVQPNPSPTGIPQVDLVVSRVDLARPGRSSPRCIKKLWR